MLLAVDVIVIVVAVVVVVVVVVAAVAVVMFGNTTITKSMEFFGARCDGASTGNSASKKSVGAALGRLESSSRCTLEIPLAVIIRLGQAVRMRRIKSTTIVTHTTSQGIAANVEDVFYIQSSMFCCCYCRCRPCTLLLLLLLLFSFLLPFVSVPLASKKSICAKKVKIAQ